MFRILSLCFFWLCSMLLYSTAVADTTPAPLEPVDKIVAVVNDDVITGTELDTRLHSIKEQLKNQSSPIPPDPVLKKQVLDRMILASLQLRPDAGTGRVRMYGTMHRRYRTFFPLSKEPCVRPNSVSVKTIRDIKISAALFRYASQATIFTPQVTDNWAAQ